MGSDVATSVSITDLYGGQKLTFVKGATRILCSRKKTKTKTTTKTDLSDTLKVTFINGYKI